MSSSGMWCRVLRETCTDVSRDTDNSPHRGTRTSLMIETAESLETSVNFCQTTRRHFPVDSNLQSQIFCFKQTDTRSQRYKIFVLCHKAYRQWQFCERLWRPRHWLPLTRMHSRPICQVGERQEELKHSTIRLNTNDSNELLHHLISAFLSWSI